MKKHYGVVQGSIFCLSVVLSLLLGCAVKEGSDRLQGSADSNQSPPIRSLLDKLTVELLDSNAVSSQSPGNPAANAQVQLKAKQRLSAILDVIDVAPEEALRVAFSKNVADSFPDSAKEYLESEIHHLKGELEVLCAFSDEDASRTRYAIKTDDGNRYWIHFVGNTEDRPKTGTRIEIPFATKIPALVGESHLIPSSEDGAAEVVAEAVTLPYPTSGVFKTLAILVNFQDQPTSKPWTPDAIKATLQDVSNYDYEASFHKTSLSADVAGWYTIPYNSTDSCDSNTNGILSNAKSKANAGGFNTSNYDRLIVIFPKMSNCRWAGLGYIGGGKTWGISWINGAPTRQVIGHEMGHNFGLYHAHSLSCSNGAIIGTIGNGCTSSDYGDPADMMGNRTAAHFNAAQKESIGWLDYPGFPGITTVQTSGNYTLEPYETYSMNPKALRIPKTSPVSSTSQYYYLEYRQPIGYDNIGLGGNLTQGMLLHQENAGGTGQNSYILNMTPSDTSFWNAAISSSKVFTDPNAPGGGVSIAFVSANSSGATVSVKFGTSTPTCVRANPTLTASPSTTQWVTPGNGASYTITLKNNDSTACSNSTFNTSATPPSGVTANPSAPAVTVAPGASGTVNVQVQSAASTSNGVYSVGVKAVNSAVSTSTGSTTVSLGVQAPCVRANPSVTLSPASQSGVVGGNVTYTINVKNNDNSQCTASGFSLSSVIPAGLTGNLSQSSISLSPGASGSATLQVSSSTATAPGAYTVSAKAVNASATSYTGTGSGTYTLTQPSGLTVKVSSDKSVYVRGATTYYANLYTSTALNGSVAPNVSIVGKLTWPDGHSQSISTTTNSSGLKWFGQDIQMSTPVGTYKFSVSATHNGTSATSSLSFVVQ